MAVQVSPFQRQQQRQGQRIEKSPLGDILSVGGAILGGIYGGGVQGAAAGAGLGSTLGNAIAPPTVVAENQQVQNQPGTVSTGSDSLQRRMGELQQGKQNLEQLAASVDSLKYVQDEDLRYKFAQPLVQATIQAQREA